MKRIFFLVLLIFALASCRSEQKPPSHALQRLLSQPFRCLKYYGFSPSSELISRVRPIPREILSYLQKIDNETNYRSYFPSKSELKMIDDYIKLLPPLTKRVLQKRLVAIYFVKNFRGSGMADFVIDKKNRLYSFIIYNPDTLKDSLDERFTFREQSCFRTNNSGLSVRVHVSDKYNGFLYVLTHESTHVVDYTLRVTDFVDPWVRYFRPFNSPIDPVHRFSKPVWKNRKTPKPPFNFPLRRKLSFYGFRHGPLLDIDQAPVVYDALVHSPFTSLYGSTLRPEDLAEYVTLYHFTHKLGLDYEIRFLKNAKIIKTWRPMENPKVLKRATTLSYFWH